MPSQKSIGDQTFLDRVIARLGLYRVFFTGTVQFNSIAFRIVGGVLTDKFLELVAVVTAVEFILNAVLDVPLGHLADRFGRVRTAVWGYVLVIFSLATSFSILFMSLPSEANWYLAVASGALLGVGKPLFGGSVEAFYQNIIVSHNDPSIEVIKAKKNSFVLSLSYGKWIPLPFVVASFSLIYLFNDIGYPEVTMLAGALLYLILINHLLVDRSKYGDPAPKKHQMAFRLLMKSVFGSFEGASATLINTLSMVFAVNILGYYMISLGRYFNYPQNEKIFLLFWFMFGFLGLGWFIKSKILPRIGPKLSRFNAAAVALFLHLSTNLAMLGVPNNISLVSHCLVLVAYMALYQLANSLLQDTATNMMLETNYESQFAAALSAMNIPSYIFVGVYSWYLSSYREGAFTPDETHQFLLATSLVGLLMVFALSFIRRSRETSFHS